MALLPGKEEDGWRDRGWRPPPGSTSNVRFSDLLFSFTLGSIRQFIQSYRAELPSDLVWRISSNCPTLTYLWCWWSSEQSEEEYYFYDQLVTICRFPPGQRRPLQSTFDRGGRHGRHALWGESCLDDGDWSERFSILLEMCERCSHQLEERKTHTTCHFNFENFPMSSFYK